MKTIIDIGTRKLGKWILYVFIFLLPGMVAGQTISVNVVLKPPYSSNYSTYENLANHAIITLIGAPRDVDIFLTGTLANTQSDFFVYTSEDFIPTGVTFTLLANQTKVIINDVPKMQFLARNNVIHQGISEPDWMNVLQNDKLPEGQYELCVQAMGRDRNGNHVELGRGCAIFSITYAQPPIITMPQDGQTLNPQQPNTVFAWTPVIGNTVGANVVYDLYVVKVMDGQNSNDAIDAAINYKANNPIIKQNLTSNQYVTQPYDLKMDSNTLYAVAVIAHDLNKKVGFQNNGRSEVVVFTYGNKEQVNTMKEEGDLSLAILSPSKNMDTIVVNNQQDLYVNWGWLFKNKLFNPDSISLFQEKHIQSYRLLIQPATQKANHKTDKAFYFQTQKNVVPKTGLPNYATEYFQSSAGNLQQAGMKNDYWYRIRVEALNNEQKVVATAQSQDFNLRMGDAQGGDSARIAGQLRYRFDGFAENYPIPNTSVRIYSDNPQYTGSDIYATTDPTGVFVAKVPLNAVAGKDIPFKMEIVSDYYKQMDTAVFHLSDTLKKGGSSPQFSIGQFITRVYSYSLTVHVIKGFSNYKVVQDHSYYDYTSSSAQPKLVKKIDTVLVGMPDSLIQQLPQGLKVMIYRKTKPGYLPPVEGDGSGISSGKSSGMIPVAQGKTTIQIDKNGKQSAYVKFDRLICNSLLDDDVYYFTAIPADQNNKGTNEEAYQDDLFEAPENELVFHKPFPADSTHFNLDTTYRIISKDPPKSTISGQLLYQWPGDPSKALRPLANRKFSVVVEYVVGEGKDMKPVVFYKGFTETKLYPNGYIQSDMKELPTGDAGTVMATGQTDANGQFTIQAVNLNDKGLIGSGEVVEFQHIPENPVETPKIKNIKDMIISPTSPSDILGISQIGITDGKNILNIKNQGLEFGLQTQQMQLNGLMNSSLNFSAAQQKKVGFQLPRFNQPAEWVRSSSHGGQNFQPPLKFLFQAPLTPIRRVYRIVLDDKQFYYNPDKNIEVQPLKAIDAGPIVAMVKEMKWNIKVEDSEASSLKLSGIKSVVFREPSSKISGQPEGEGDGKYRMKKLISPQFTGGDVTLPSNQPQATQKEGAGLVHTAGINQWQANGMPVVGKYIFSNESTIPENSYEWVEDTTTNQAGIAVVTRVLSGFHDYNLELASNPQVGNELFYEYKIQQLDPDKVNATYDDNIKPSENGKYWDLRKKDIPVANIILKLKPMSARVGGRVQDQSSLKGLGGALVAMKIMKQGKDTVLLRFTDTSGYFEILDIYKKAGIGKNVKNIDVEMNAYYPGYKQVAGVKKGTISATGKQYIDNILMDPRGTMKGYVENETGAPVEAYIKRSDGLVVKTGSASKNQFSIPTASNQKETLYVIPVDAGYFPDTIQVNVKDGINQLNKILVYRRKHRMNFFVTDESTGKILAGALVAISDSLYDYTKPATNMVVDRPATFNFENVSVNNYTVLVTGPKEMGYVPKMLNITNEESKDFVLYNVPLKKGAVVSGTVSLDGKPVAGAKVYLDYHQQHTGGKLKLPGSAPGKPLPGYQTVSGGGLPGIVTTSDAQGHYTLPGIPVNGGTVNIVSTLDTSFTVIGDKQVVNLGSTGSVDLHLKSYQQMTIKTLFGFPLSIEKLEPTGTGNQVKISGKVDISKGVSDFTFLSGTQNQVSISDIVFVGTNKNGQLEGAPSASEVKLDATSSLKLSYLERYNVLVTASGENAAAPELLKIGKNTSGRGIINGYVNIVDNSFNYPSSYLNFTQKDQFYLCTKTGNQLKNKLDAILAPTGTGTGLTTVTQYHLGNLKAQAIQFKFLQFNATADPLKSFIDLQGKIHLDVSLQCKIPNAKPENFTVHAGGVILDNEKVYPSTDTTVLLVQLEKWVMEIRNWSIDPMKGGIYSKNGLIKTGKLDIPFTEFNLRPDMLVMNEFKLSELQLGGGVKKLEGINPNHAAIVYDEKTGSDMSGHWKLGITGAGDLPAASIRNLSFNGSLQNKYLSQDIHLEYIELLSNGEDILTIQQSAVPMIINQNGLAQFRPQSISSGPDFFKVTGGLDIPAPRFAPIMTTLQFSGQPAAMKMEVVPVEMSFEGKGYVNFFSFKDKKDTITQNKIVIPGYVVEEGGFNPVNATFYADGNKPADAYYHIEAEKGFLLNLTSEAPAGGKSGNYNFKILEGGMKVPKGANDWDLLTLTGNLLTNDATLATGGNNTNQNKMTFTVKGGIEVDGEAVKVTNISLPFGKMNMVYEFETKSLIGSLMVNDQQLGPFKAGGTVQMAIDPQGWYFLGACMVSTGIPGPLNTMNMGFLLGNHNFSGGDWTNVKDAVSQYSFDKSSLCWLQGKANSGGIHGFYITAGKHILDESIGFEVPMAALTLQAEVGAEASLYTDFSNPGVQLSGGLYGRVKAGAAALNVSVNGEFKVQGSFTGAVTAQEMCIGGKLGASLSISGSIDLELEQISLGSFQKNAVLKLNFSKASGLSKDFYFGTAPPADCNSKSICGN